MGNQSDSVELAQHGQMSEITSDRVNTLCRNGNQQLSKPVMFSCDIGLRRAQWHESYRAWP